MTSKSIRRSCAGFTLAEILVGVGVLSAVAIASYSMLLNSSVLFAKNVSLNTSGTVLRTALDRMYSDINQAYGVLKLINDDGSAATNTTAAGVAFDVYLGGPYVVTNPGTAGLPASAQTFQMKHYSSDALTAQPLPAVNDVIMLDNGITRPVVSTCTGAVSSNVRTLAVSLKAPLGSAVFWSSIPAPGTTKTAFLVHKKAYIVAPVNGTGELRLYNNAEAVTDYSDPTNYVVLARGLSVQTGYPTPPATPEYPPFSLVTQSENSFLNIAMRVEDQKFNKTLGLTADAQTKQAKEFNTFLRLDTMLRPRN